MCCPACGQALWATSVQPPLLVVSVGESAMDVSDGLCDVGGCPGSDGSHEDAVAIVVIRDNKVIVAVAGGLW